jgi:hypothetical protein
MCLRRDGQDFEKELTSDWVQAGLRVIKDHRVTTLGQMMRVVLQLTA